MNKHEQLYELSRNVLPFLPSFKKIDGKQCKLRIYPRHAEYSNGDVVVSFNGYTTLDACKKALEWVNRYPATSITTKK